VHAQQVTTEKHIMQEIFDVEKNLEVAVHMEETKLIKTKRIYYETLIFSKFNIVLYVTS